MLEGTTKMGQEWSKIWTKQESGSLNQQHKGTPMHKHNSTNSMHNKTRKLKKIMILVQFIFPKICKKIYFYSSSPQPRVLYWLFRKRHATPIFIRHLLYSKYKNILLPKYHNIIIHIFIVVENKPHYHKLMLYSLE